MVKQSKFAEWSPALEVAIYSDTWMAGTKEAAALALQENKPFLREAKAPMGRIGDPEDVAAAALFLATDEAKFVSGAGIAVDGGAAVNF